MRDPASVPLNSYNDLDYPFYSHHLTHPSHLAMTAILMGMKPAGVESCRVLEIGCAAGGNIIPMAYTLPQATIVGVDLAERQIVQGQQIIRDLGLNNITLLAMNLLDIDAAFGQFDYIIAHGVYSWVPPDVQDCLMKVIRQNLAPNGVAWVSYNTLPGWALRRTLREMTLYHVREIEKFDDRIENALSFLNFLARESTPQAFPAYQPYLTQVVQSVTGLNFNSDDRQYYYHEDLEDSNTPLYFFQFIDHAARHNLKYLAEAEIHSMTPYEFSPETVQTIRQFSGDQIAFEQHLDFLRNRMFRQTLLCHRDALLEGMLLPERLEYLKFAACLKPCGPVDLIRDSSDEFQTAEDKRLTLSLPIQKATFLYLLRIYPRAAAIGEIFSEACKLLVAQGGTACDEDRQHINTALLATYLYANAVEFIAWQPQYTTHASLYPKASLWVRWQARTQSRSTSLRHTTVSLALEERLLLELLDGLLGREVLLERYRQALVDHGLNEPMSMVRLEEMLHRFAYHALLES